MKEKYFESIIRNMKDPDFELRLAAVNAAELLKSSDPEMVNALTGALGDERGDVRYGALAALGKLRPVPDEVLVPAVEIIKKVETEDYKVANYTAWVVGRMGLRAKSALPELESALIKVRAMGKVENSDPDKEFERITFAFPDFYREKLKKTILSAIEKIKNDKGIKPFSIPYIIEPEKKVPVIREADVAVVGAGAAGLIAAAASAMTGAKTVLLESCSSLIPAQVYGGTAGIFNAFRGSLVENEIEKVWRNGLGDDIKSTNLQCLEYAKMIGHIDQIMGGAAWEYVRYLIRYGALPFKSEPEALSAFRFQCDPEAAGYAAIRFMEDMGVDVLLQARVCGTIMSGDSVTGVYIEGKSGRCAVRAKNIVDCSGEADVAFMAGAPCSGNSRTRTYGSQCFVLSNFPGEPDTPYRSGQDSANGPDEYTSSYTQIAKRTGFDLKRSIDDRGELLYRFSGHGVIISDLNGCDIDDITMGEIESRKYTYEFVQFYKNNIPGFENVHLRQTVPQVLWRAARNIIGDYVFTDNDLKNENKTFFNDVVYFHRAPRHKTPGGYVHVPYRMLLPRDVENLLVAGKCASGAYIIRSTVSCMGMGEAAGTAAALSAKLGTTPRKLDIGQLQDQLQKNGAIVKEPIKVTIN